MAVRSRHLAASSLLSTRSIVEAVRCQHKCDIRGRAARDRGLSPWARVGISDTDVLDGITELAERGLVERMHGHPGNGLQRIHRIYPESGLFFLLDHAVHGWDTEADAHALSALVVNERTNAQVACERLGWSVRRINPVCA